MRIRHRHPRLPFTAMGLDLEGASAFRQVLECVRCCAALDHSSINLLD
jgi:hypothetical protein